jgi:predicted nucleotidyltransferase
MPYGLKDEVVAEINSILSRFPQVDQAILFGSRAMGNYKNGSDIDLTLLGHDLSLNILSQISNILDDSYLPYTFDLSLYEQIENCDLINHIGRVGISFYKK